MTHLLAHGESFLADADGMLPEMGAEILLNEKGGQKGRDVHVIEHALKAPPNALPSHLEAPGNLLTVSSAKNHSAGAVNSEIYPKIPCLHQMLQLIQEFRIFFR